MEPKELKTLEILKGAYNDLSRAIDKLIEVSADNVKNELFLKLNKITTKVLKAKYELTDDVIEPLENPKDVKNDSCRDFS